MPKAKPSTRDTKPNKTSRMPRKWILIPGIIVGLIVIVMGANYVYTEVSYRMDKKFFTKLESGLETVKTSLKQQYGIDVQETKGCQRTQLKFTTGNLNCNIDLMTKRGAVIGRAELEGLMRESMALEATQTGDRFGSYKYGPGGCSIYVLKDKTSFSCGKSVVKQVY